MKNLINKIKKIKWKTIISLVVIVSLTGFVVVRADSIFLGWTDRNKEYAWNVYSFTDWGSLDGLNFATDGSYTKANVSKRFREDYAKNIKNTLSEKNVPNGLYNSKEYTELVLDIIYWIDGYDDVGATSMDKSYGYYVQNNAVQLKVKRFGNDNLYDWKIPEGEKFGSKQRQAILSIYNSIIQAEKNYSSKYEPVNIYEPDNRLGMIIQSVIYGQEYANLHENYTENNAKEYFEKNATSIGCTKQANDFAKSVLNTFSGVMSNGHSVIG